MGRRTTGSSRRAFLKTAGAAATTVLMRDTLWAQQRGVGTASAARTGDFFTINPKFMMTPDQAWEWNAFKAQAGPTYAGGTGWKRYTDFLIARMPELGAVDLDYVDIPYDHYIVEDWPDRRTHLYDSGVAVEKLVSDGTPVPVVASYGMTSGSTSREGITAPMVYYDPANPPANDRIAGKILVFQTAPQPAPPYSDSFLDNYTLTDYEWRSPGKWAPLFTPPPLGVTSSYHSRWVWSQLNRFATIGIAGKAAGMVVVYDLSPGAAFGLAQRSVYTANGAGDSLGSATDRSGVGAGYINCPTLTLDRVNGAKVLTDARAGKTATLTLIARFQRDTGRAIVAYLPGANYGTPRDEQVLLATHTDAMSLIEENGGIGLLGIMGYFNHIPKASRPRTLVFYFDCRHFMPGGEGSWPQFDYYTIHKDKLKSIVATVGLEHMGGRQTVEGGVGGNEYTYSKELPENGGVITSLIDVHNNNIWLIEAIARAATDNKWPRVDVKSGNAGPGVNGGFQGSVKSPMNKGRGYRIPGLGLAGDWPGGWTQTYAQLDTEAGPHGFDKDYFVTQVAGLSQVTGDLMKVKPLVIDLGWGELKSTLVKLAQHDFVASQNAADDLTMLVDQYVAAFRKVEAGSTSEAGTLLKELTATVAKRVVPDKQASINKAIDGQLSKLG